MWTWEAMYMSKVKAITLKIPAALASEFMPVFRDLFAHRRHAVLFISITLLGFLIVGSFASFGGAEISVYSHHNWTRNVTIRPLSDLSGGASGASLSVVRYATDYLDLINVLNGLYFMLLWHRWHHVYLRSALAALLSAIQVVLNAISLAVFESIIISPFDLENASTNYPEVSLVALESVYASWRAQYTADRFAKLAWTLAVALTQAIAITFWIWLLPLRWRLPNSYKPIVSSRQKRHRARDENPEAELQRLLVTTNNDGYLEGVFKEHEREFLARATSFSVLPVNAKMLRPSKQHEYSHQGNSGKVRYMRSVPFWAVNADTENLWMLSTVVFTMVFPGKVFAEVLAHTSSGERGEQLKWTRMAELVTLLLWLCTVGMVMFLIRHRVPFDYRILGLLTIKTSTICAMLACAILSIGCDFRLLYREYEGRLFLKWGLNIVLGCVLMFSIPAMFMFSTSMPKAHRKTDQVKPLAQAPDEQMEQYRTRQSGWEETRKAWQGRYRNALVRGRKAGRVTATFLMEKAIPVLVSPLIRLIKGIDGISNEIIAHKARNARRAREGIARSEYEIILD